jgi:hypothetical protein
MIPQDEADIVKLVWMPVGKQPCLTDFGGEGASTWATGAEAVRQAVAHRAQHADRAEEPWIKVGDTLYDGAQIEKLDEAETEQRIGEDEAMPGDEPWE